MAIGNQPSSIIEIESQDQLIDEEIISDPKTQTNNLLNYLESQDFSKKINLKEILKVDFELSLAEEDQFNTINN